MTYNSALATLRDRSSPEISVNCLVNVYADIFSQSEVPNKLS